MFYSFISFIFIPPFHVFIPVFHVFIPPLHVFLSKDFSPCLIGLLTEINQNRQINRINRTD
ncbi:hypothetical protein Hanom_Chr16g01486341 [Helianthus anomalus]